MALWHYLKMKSLNILNCSLLQANILVFSPQKHGGKDGPVLSLVTKYCYRGTYHLNVEAISFAIR